MMTSNKIYVGANRYVAAIDKKSGLTLWQTKLKGGLTGGDRFVTLLADSEFVYAHTGGELFCLDATTGTILWKNALDGLGYDVASLAIEGSASLSANTRRKRENEADSYDPSGHSSST